MLGCEKYEEIDKKKKLFQLTEADDLKDKLTDNVNLIPCLPLPRRFVVNSVVFHGRHLHLF